MYKWRLEKNKIKTRYCCTNNETENVSVRRVKRKKKTAFTNGYSSMISYTQKKQLKARVSDGGTVFSVYSEKIKKNALCTAVLLSVLLHHTYNDDMVS